MESISDVLCYLNTEMLSSVYGSTSFIIARKTIVTLLDFMLKDFSKSFLMTNQWLEKKSPFLNRT